MELKSATQLKFVPPKSFVHPNFWYKLADIKLHIDKLQDSPKDVFAFINSAEQSRILVEVDCTAFNRETTITPSHINCKGILVNKNTIEEFKNTDKNLLIRNLSNDYYDKLFSKEKLDSSSELVFFLLFSFADFKSHKYYYWFAFPALRDIVYHCPKISISLTEEFDEGSFIKFDESIKTFRKNNSEPMFIYKSKTSSISEISDLISHKERENNLLDIDLQSTYFCCIDHGTGANHSWLLRQFLGYLLICCPRLTDKHIKCICLREKLESSIVTCVQMPSSEVNLDQSSWIGWEADDNGKYIPRLANMSKMMDPLVLAEKSISLNLTLMKWRLLPDLNIDIIKQTKFLLFGAGTLGCGVARSLLAWGAQNITFIDCGKVSLSNPVRQNLYLYEDALNGKLKAPTAAERLKQINPCIISTGHCLKIPMPGHPIGESQREETNGTLDELENLVKTHDVMFLLTDSRESRWYPSMLAAYYGKMAINAALGFDSFLVMRHGSKSKPAEQQMLEVKGLKAVHGSHLGCYFCTDIVAPGNSLKDRTLDQQCTVTRPAVSNIASSLAVELVISLLQQEDRDATPAYYRTSKETDYIGDIPEQMLGIVPHSIRGNLGAFNYLITATEKFSECIACSKQIMNKFENEGNKFVLDVLNSSKVLEDVAGISKLTCDMDEMIDFGDSDAE